MKTKGMMMAVIVILLLAIPAMAMAEWGFSPMMSADGRVDGAMASMSWSFGGVKKSQEIILAKNISRQPQQRSVTKQEAESQQFFSAKEMEKLTASLQLPPPVDGRKYLKIGAKPVDPKTFDFLKEDAHILLKDAEVKTIDNGSKISVGWLRAGEILVTSKGETRAIRIWRCGNPILSELYIVAPKPASAKVEAAPIVAAITPAETPVKQEAKKPELFPQSTIDKIAGKGAAPTTTTGWTTKKKVLVGAVVVAVVVAAVAYTVDQQNDKTTTNTTTTTTVVVGQDPPNGNGPGPNPPS